MSQGVLGQALAIGLWLALVVGLGGTLARLVWYLSRAPQPQLVLHPAPRRTGGVVMRVLAEALFFRSLWRADRGAWVLAWGFHASLALVVVRHAWLVLDAPRWWLGLLVEAGPWLSGLLLASAVGLLVRRLAIRRLRLVSSPSDYLWIGTFAVLAATGAWRAWFPDASIGQARVFVQAFVRFEVAEFPADGVLVAHLLMAIGILLVFPISKLMHGPGLFLSPTLVHRERGADVRPRS